MTFKWTYLVIALAAVGAPAGGAGAQAPASSPINDLLTQATDALNNLDNPRADSIAQEVLTLGSQLRRSQAILAWEIAAAAKFPEEGKRDSTAARRDLAHAILLDLDATLPMDIRYKSLERLLDDEKQTAIGMAVRLPRSQIIYGGSVGDAVLEVVTAQPADVWLYARSQEQGTELLVDSAMDTRDAGLRIPALRGLDPVLPSGAYEFVVHARDRKTGAVMERKLEASVTAPALHLVPPAVPLDSTKLRPEIKEPNRVLGIATGVIVGGLTVAVNQALKADPPIASVGTDNRATEVGVAIGVSTLVAELLDHGEVLPANRAANEKLENDAASRAAAVALENTRRREGYRAQITLLMEDK
jgi:hypothetical protein